MLTRLGQGSAQVLASEGKICRRLGWLLGVSARWVLFYPDIEGVVRLRSGPFGRGLGGTIFW